ncbi:MAG: class I adenylate-forming enzyme family protein [Acidimicrobiales bacterium]
MTLTWPNPSLSEDLRLALVGPGAPFELIEEEVLGTPMAVFADRPRTIVEILRSGADRFAGRPYVVFPERLLTFDDIIGPVAAVARSLKETYGVGRGDRVAICSANCVEFVLTFWAVTVLGGVTVALNGWWTGPEMAHALELTEPKLLLGDRRCLGRLAGIDLPGLPRVLFEEDFDALEAAGAGAALPDEDIEEDDPFLILFTSGTTGRSKGAMISHRSNIHFGLATRLGAAEGMATAQADQPPPPPTLPCSISASPMFHVAGLNCSLVLAPMNGLTIVYPPVGKWREASQLELTERHGATTWSLVPTQLWRLLDWPGLGDYDLSSLKTVGGGSAVWAPELLRRLEEKLPWVRPGLALGYGMTETNGLGTSLRLDSTYTHPDSIGRPSATMQVEIRDPDTHAALPDGQVGEIAMRSGATFLGYWRNPEATAKALDADRWYHTGDFGHARDGFVYLEGRRQDLIIRGGENIYPVEIENRLIENPGVAEAAVVGVTHATLGHEVAAYVVEKVPGTLAAADIREWCSATLAGFKVPTLVEFVPELPHNASGKVLKHLLGSDLPPSDFVQE